MKTFQNVKLRTKFVAGEKSDSGSGRTNGFSLRYGLTTQFGLIGKGCDSAVRLYSLDLRGADHTTVRAEF